MNSAKVAGGVAPPPLHSTVPEPQSPVMQEKWPVESVEQRVRPQIRPDQEGGMVMELDWVGWRGKPVVGNGGVPAPERRPV